MLRKPPPQDDLEMNQMAQAELIRLQRQYRIMEGDRQSYTDEMKFYLEKQRKVIFALDNEKDELLTNLNISKSLHNECAGHIKSQRLLILLSRQDELEDQIKTEKSQLTELESQIRKVEREVLNLKKKDIPELQICEKAVECERNMELLENRLYVATVKLNKMLTGNGSLRQEINHLLKERAHFNNLYQMLIGQYTMGKKIMLDLIEQATLAYDQREEAQAKLQALKERDRADLLLHSQEMRELQRRFDLDSKLQDFLGVKGQKRIMADLEAKEAIKKQQQKETTEQLIMTYNSILEQIKQFSGESDVDRLAARFLKQEEENFTLFNYVNELNNELEVLQEQTNELMLSIDEQRTINRERAAEQQETISSLADDLEAGRSETQQGLAEQDMSISILDSLLGGVEALFSESRCNTAPILHLLGEEAMVSTFNVMLFLGIIQQQIGDLQSFLVQPEPSSPVIDKLVPKSKITPPASSKTHSSLSSPLYTAHEEDAFNSQFEGLIMDLI